MIYFLIYVDDIIVVSSSDATAQQLLSNQTNDFSLKDLGPLHYFQGIEVSGTKSSLSLAQCK